MLKRVMDKVSGIGEYGCVLRCGGCRWYAEEDEDSPPYCIVRDVYTFVKGTDRACGDFERRVGG